MKKINIKIISLFFIGAGVVSSCSDDDSSIIDGMSDAVVNTDPSGAPPRIMDESWSGHSEVLYRQYFDDYVAVYYDDVIERPLEWPYEFLSNAWDYTTDTYGSFGNENILYAIFHSEGDATTFQTIYDAFGFSLIDVPLNGVEKSGSNMDRPLWEISHIVENSSNLVSGSPASVLWGDNWSEIFTYDLYSGLGMEDEAQRVYDQYMQTTSDSPESGVNWFKDWYYPIYQEHGTAALSDFFTLVSGKFPKVGDAYAKDMTLGELVHFYSGATGEDLLPLAEAAFGWSDDREKELLQARADYPLLDYPFDPIVIVTDLTFDAQISVNHENTDGPDANEGSSKVIDNNTSTKYLYFGYSPNMWMQQEFSEPQIVNRYTLTSGNDSPERDPKTWTLEGSSDSTTWEVLDTRSNETFNSRGLTKEFIVDNQDAYNYYRINITENGGATLFQLAEWRLINRTSLLEEHAGDGNSESGTGND